MTMIQQLISFAPFTPHTSLRAHLALIAGSLMLLTGCFNDKNTHSATSRANPAATQTTTTPSGEKEKAYFAGGCFWCTEADFEKLPGVYEAISGYTGGDLQNPTYKQVSYTETGHFEAVEVTYDPQQLNFRELVDYHFRHIDPLDADGQFCDRGTSYRTAIFVSNNKERKAATASRKAAEKILGQDIVTPILDLKTFWPAEDYHQDYYKKNPIRYQYYRRGCGRDRRLAQLWGE